MFRVPCYLPDMSQRLSLVMDDIGVNATTVNVRRRTNLLQESMETLVYKVLGKNKTLYYFGSQTEGTTTIGLNSDTDLLFCDEEFNVMQEWSEWKRGKINLLMIQDESTPPGYCRLQVLRPDIPVARDDIVDEDCEYDMQGRVLLKNSFAFHCQYGAEKHGPAETFKHLNSDIVLAFLCRSHSVQVLPWMQRCILHQCKDFNLMPTLLESGCFVVPTGHSSSIDERLEWRISTSIAERYMMFSMNITQIRCYVLLKLILKTFITPNFPDKISSYQCKTVVMYLIENTHRVFWNQENLLLCVMLCLSLLQSCILTSKCPHYFIPGNNLMEGRVDAKTREQLVRAFEHIICSGVHTLLEIQIDNVGDRLMMKYTPLLSNNYFRSSDQVMYKEHSKLYFSLMHSVLLNVMNLTKSSSCSFHTILDTKDTLKSLITIGRNGHDDEHFAALLLIPSLCSTHGSLLASACISRGQILSPEAVSFLSLGVVSDIASGRLKLASALFCAGDMEWAEVILRNISERYYRNRSVMVGVRRSTELRDNRLRFPLDITKTNNLKQLRSYFAFEVTFTRREKHCVPHALQYEMFRCTEEDIATRNERNNYWMDWAVVDALSYLYYLQYLTYNELGRQDDQQRALNKLVETCATEPRLYHRETALNLLGQCMEKEGRLMDAFSCYMYSLNELPTHNVARWHIVNVLRKMLN